MFVMAKRVAKRSKMEPGEERLFAYLGDPLLSGEELQQLRAQIGSAQLSDALWSFGRQLFAEELHRACQSRLPDYALLQISGQDAAVTHPRVKAHLDECERCSQALEDLLPAARTAPALEPSPSAPPIWERVAAAGERVLRLFTEVRIQMQRGQAAFGELPSPLAPARIALPAMRGARGKPGEAQTRAQMLPLVSAEHDLAINLMIGPVSDGRASLTVQITRSSAGQPLAGVRVALRDEARRLLASERTQADGRTTFSHIGSGRYLIEVKQAGNAWELPLTFTWQD
jgi:hypothetical protein